MNKYPRWKYWLLLIVFVIAFVYALPNLFGDDPSVQVSSQTAGESLTATDLSAVKQALHKAQIPYTSIKLEDKSVLARFSTINEQQKAKEDLKTHFAQKYMIAISLAPAAPGWLQSFGAEPMRLGLDLRGGVHFLLQVDVNTVLKHREQGDIRNIAQTLRDKRIRYAGLEHSKKTGIDVKFRSDDILEQALPVLKRRFPDYAWQQLKGQWVVSGRLTQAALLKIRQYTVEQTMQTLQRRVNELGVSEASVQQQGMDRIAVDLPGVQDATQAKNLLGKTATLEFHLVDTTHDPMAAAQGVAPPGSQLYTFNGQPVLLKSQVVLTGDAITNASAGFDQNGRPSVNIRMGGQGESLFYKVTGQNIGKPLAVVYIETKSHPIKVNGKEKIIYKKVKRIINIATIQSALGSPFQITGLNNTEIAKNLSLLLRAGALLAPVTIVAERNVGPSMGQQNIHQGMLSIAWGLGLVVIFMILYYSLFGVIADIGLFLNLIFLVAVMSMLGAVLSFPGIAAMVLTLGMAVDANVLIFERIREELRAGVTVQKAIYAGYEKAFSTIVDANVTTLIAAVVLFSLGTGAIKGFAITLTIGLITSMFTAVTYTRAIVNLRYGGKRISQLPIGMRIPETGAAANEIKGGKD
jgi:preprotein translocase subunit SecD